MATDKDHQLELFTITNPCIGVCQSNARGYCIGCLRSRDERFNWHLKTAQEQRKIIHLLAQRRARLAQQQRTTAATGDIQSSDTAQGSLFDPPDNFDPPNNNGHQ